ncbi:hypothetical protein ACF0H5_004070 [Mactra antiquata]
MKEMQDANLFGDETVPNTPSPHITEISLKDIAQAVDLNEFRKQNLEEREHCREKLLPVKEVDNEHEHTTVASNAGFDFTPPQTTPDLSTEVFSLFPDCCSENDTREHVTTIVPGVGQPDKGGYDVCQRWRQTLESSLDVVSETDNENCSENGYDIEPDEATSMLSTKAPNGDIFSNNHKQSNNELTFAPNILNHDAEKDVFNDDLYPSTCRRSSTPETITKDSRTFHPRKRQTVHGNRRDRNQLSIEVDKFSKEELMLMWKSSELELNAKLKEAVKDKQRLQSKLTALKLHMSTPV